MCVHFCGPTEIAWCKNETTAENVHFFLFAFWFWYGMAVRKRYENCNCEYKIFYLRLIPLSLSFSLAFCIARHSECFRVIIFEYVYNINAFCSMILRFVCNVPRLNNTILYLYCSEFNVAMAMPNACTRAQRGHESVAPNFHKLNTQCLIQSTRCCFDIHAYARACVGCCPPNCNSMQLKI